MQEVVSSLFAPVIVMLMLVIISERIMATAARVVSFVRQLL